MGHMGVPPGRLHSVRSYAKAYEEPLSLSPAHGQPLPGRPFTKVAKISMTNEDVICLANVAIPSSPKRLVEVTAAGPAAPAPASPRVPVARLPYSPRCEATPSPRAWRSAPAPPPLATFATRSGPALATVVPRASGGPSLLPTSFLHVPS